MHSSTCHPPGWRRSSAPGVDCVRSAAVAACCCGVAHLVAVSASYVAVFAVEICLK